MTGRFVSLRVKLAVVLTAFVAVAAAMRVAVSTSRMQAAGAAAARRHGEQLALVLASAVAPGVDFDDTNQVVQILRGLDATPDGLYAAVYRQDGSRLGAWNQEHVPALTDRPTDAPVSRIDGGV